MPIELTPIAQSTLASLAEAKTHLGVSGSDDDAVITDMLEAATEAMERYAGRHLVSTSVTELVDGTGKRRVWLGEPAESITSVHADSDQAWADANLVDADDYNVDGCAVDKLNQIWTVGKRNTRVIYLAGFATVPEDLEHACKVQVAKLYAEWQTTKEGRNAIESENVEGWARKWRGHAGLDQEVKDILDRYIPQRL